MSGGQFIFRPQWPNGVSSGSTTAELNTWQHVAGVWDGSEMRIYVGGVLRGSASYTAASSMADPMRIGAQGGAPNPNPVGEVFAGNIGPFRISSIARYTADFTPATSFGSDADTLALWLFSEGTGQTSADASGNAHTVTLGATSSVEVSDPQWSADAP